MLSTSQSRILGLNWVFKDFEALFTQAYLSIHPCKRPSSPARDAQVLDTAAAQIQPVVPIWQQYWCMSPNTDSVLWDQLYLCSCCILICVNGTAYTWMHRKHLSISCGQRWLFALGMPKWLRLIPFLCSMTLTFSWAFTRCNCTPERLLMVWNSLFMPI